MKRKRVNRPAGRPGRRCPSRKKVYATQTDAANHLAVIRLLGGPINQERRTYHCPLCGHWHLTSQTQRTQPQILKKDSPI